MIQGRGIPKFHKGQVVVIKSTKKQCLFRILGVQWFADAKEYGYKQNRHNWMSEHMLRALTTDECSSPILAESIIPLDLVGYRLKYEMVGLKLAMELVIEERDNPRTFYRVDLLDKAVTAIQKRLEERKMEFAREDWKK